MPGTSRTTLTTDTLAVLQARPNWLGQVLVDAPAWLVVLAAAVTQLGDAWFLFALLGLVYWLAPPVAANPRAVGATLIGVALGALAVVVGLKALFAFGRPPDAGTVVPPAWLPDLTAEAVRAGARADGFGFPSGHALSATAVYGGMAWFYDVGTRRSRRFAAAIVVAAVAASRVVLGVHFLADVVAGVVAGLATLWLFHGVARSGFRPHPDRVFFVAGLLGLAAVVVALATGHGPSAVEAGVAAGGGIGGYLVWRLRGTEDAPVGPGGALVGLALAGAPFGYAAVVATSGVPAVVGVLPDTPPVQLAAAVPTAAVAVALVVAWPTLLDRIT